MHRNGFATRFAGPSYRLVSEIVPPLHLKSRRGFRHSARSISLALPGMPARRSLAPPRLVPVPLRCRFSPTHPTLFCAAPAAPLPPRPLSLLTSLLRLHVCPCPCRCPLLPSRQSARFPPVRPSLPVVPPAPYKVLHSQSASIPSVFTTLGAPGRTPTNSLS